MGIEVPFRRGRRISLRADIRIAADEDNFSEATLIDISRFGFSAEALHHFQQQTPLTIAFSHGGQRRARAVWNEGFLEGVAFDKPLDPAEFDALVSALQDRSAD